MTEGLRTPLEYHQWAASLEDGTPVAETAKGVCLVRQLDPYNQVWSFDGWLTRWQAVALEAVLMAAIAAEEPKS